MDANPPPPLPPPRRRGFPIARALWAFSKRARANWLERHRHPFSYYVHLIGIPLAFAGLALLFVLEEWWWALAALAFGYLLQYIGHLVEGNDMGELVAVKRLLGLPYVAVAPRSAEPNEPPKS